MYDEYTDWVHVESHSVTLADKTKVEVTLSTIKDWPDPGDAHKIELVGENFSSVCTNLDGWIRHKNNSSVARFKGVNYLVLFGWPYASEPRLCSIFDLRSGDLIFNMNKDLVEMTEKNIHSSTFEFEDGTSFIPKD